MGRQETNLKKLQKRLGYEFKDLSLLRLALTHRSLAGGPRENNERLEFLGDAVLQLTVSTHLYVKHPQLPEGCWLKSDRSWCGNLPLLRQPERST